jgi:hypothetical protein
LNHHNHNRPKTTQATYAAQGHQTSRNAEDWAVLQAILGEDEDDDESDHDGWMDTAPAKNPFSFHDTTNTDDKDVNDILESDDEDEDVDGIMVDASTLSVTLPWSSDLPSPPPPPTNVHVIQEPLPMDEEISRESVEIDSDMAREAESSRQRMLPASQICRTICQCASPQPSRQRDSIDGRVATRAYAQNYERKLLKSGHREIIAAHGEA